MVEQYFPQRATSYFNATAMNTSYASVLEANTATIIYDEYNKGLLEEIDKLNAQIEELQAQATLTESQKEQLNTLQSTLDGLRVDYNTAQNEIAYLNQQIDVMREEYQKKIDQLIKDNEGKEPSNDDTNTTPSTDDTRQPVEDNKFMQVAAIAMGGVLVIALVFLLIPTKKGGKANGKK